MENRWKDLLGLVGWLCVTLLVAAFGAQFGAGSWYEDLQKPSWTPPSWLFPPIWITLYVVMALAAWLVWRKHGFGGASWALGAYLIHLLFNGAWSWIFFGMQAPGYALVDIVVLWASILILILLFFRRRIISGWLLMPYLLWVTFAMALNFAIWRMNM